MAVVHSVSSLEEAIEHKKYFISYLKKRYPYLDDDMADNVFSDVIERILSQGENQVQLSKGYIMQSMINQCVDTFRKGYYVSYYSDLNYYDGYEVAPEHIGLFKKIRPYIYQLSARNKQILLLRWRFKMTYEEIAILLNSNANAIKAQYTRALYKFKDLLKTKNISEL